MNNDPDTEHDAARHRNDARERVPSPVETEAGIRASLRSAVRGVAMCVPRKPYRGICARSADYVNWLRGEHTRSIRRERKFS